MKIIGKCRQTHGPFKMSNNFTTKNRRNRKMQRQQRFRSRFSIENHKIRSHRSTLCRSLHYMENKRLLNRNRLWFSCKNERLPCLHLSCEWFINTHIAVAKRAHTRARQKSRLQSPEYDAKCIECCDKSATTKKKNSIDKRHTKVNLKVKPFS